ncbi:AAA domain-containing protein, putative AbiEii toxin, Type IV TA system [Prosthecobacter debontii]|uniref:AAA domain-containing protein, putative AbiEii toxin, Type IV TA system n=1 Tax=Prosthecobacter debontii TaxID=48467 RepID=A0A1T4YGC1_9BACT|nr:AAA family ATPase [Prosthecobacter debontii]SKB00819.1 AAA domain-containing protein, putative AbiEii toxin, Type IV TA system [Prosthecobacter debontii]
MITRIRIQNYRSFVDAEVKLRPFSLVVGANGSGKSNLLRALQLAFRNHTPFERDFVSADPIPLEKHVNYQLEKTTIQGWFDDKLVRCTTDDKKSGDFIRASEPVWVYNIHPGSVSGIEDVIDSSTVKADGQGTVQVLESLKSGDREDLFDLVEANFKWYVPEVEKLSLRTVEKGKKQIQVREKSLKELLPATELSEGTRLILCILTIIHQEEPPPIILLEDIDRGLHPRLFEYMAPLMKDIAERHDINILATTHNPYLVDCFKDDKDAVIIVEKKDGASTLSTLADRLEGLDYDSVDPDDMPLGNLWFSGLVGGVPAKITRRPEK